MKAELFFRAAAEHGEGALWDQDRRALWWVDITGSKVHLLDPASGQDREFTMGAHVGCVVPEKGGFAVAALKSGFARLKESGELEILAAMEFEAPYIRFNDGKCDPAGRLWAGTMAYGGRAGAGSLFCLEHDLSVSRKIKGVNISNGLGWNAEATKMYYIDSPTQRVLEFRYQNQSGSIESPRVCLEIPKAMGVPDGMCLDAEGLAWIALYGAGKVIRADLSAGKIVDEVEVPGLSQTTSCALDEKGTLYITTARENFDEAAAAREPLAGSIFAAKCGVPGQQSRMFEAL